MLEYYLAYGKHSIKVFVYEFFILISNIICKNAHKLDTDIFLKKLKL